MREKILAVLMDTILVSLFILLSSNYPESLPHYNPNTSPNFRIGSHSTSIHSNATDNSDAKHLKFNSINFDPFDSEKFSTIPVGLISSSSFHAPTNAMSNVEPVQGNPYTSIFSTALNYIIVTEHQDPA